MTAPVLEVAVGASPRFTAALATAHVLGAVGFLLSGLPLWVAGSGAAVALAAGLRLARLHGLRRGRSALAQVRVGPAARVELVLADGSRHTAGVEGVPVANGLMTVLRLRGAPRGCGAVVLFRDGCGEADYRRLQVFVRWALPEGVGFAG